MCKPLKRDLKLANTQNSKQHLTDAVSPPPLRCAGYYCSGRAASPTPSDGLTGNICPVEHYCPSGSTSPLVCPDGMYSNTTGTVIHLTQPGHDMIYHTGLNSPPFPLFFLFFYNLKGQRCARTVPWGRTACRGKVSSSVRQDTTVWAGVLREYCPALPARTALSLASAKWSSASFVQQVRVLSSGCFHCCSLRRCKVFQETLL